MSLLKEKCFSIKNIGWLIKFRYNSVSINEALLELLSIYLIVVVQSWKSATLKKMNGIKDVYSRIRSTIKLLKSEYFAIRIHFTGSKIEPIRKEKLQCLDKNRELLYCCSTRSVGANRNVGLVFCVWLEVAAYHASNDMLSMYLMVLNIRTKYVPNFYVSIII